MSTTPATQNRKRNRLVIGAVTAVVAAALVAGAGYWWQDRNELSQASAEDCKLAQQIVTEAEEISTGPAPDAQKWWKETGDERRAQMKDGYLGAKISQYEGWALATASVFSLPALTWGAPRLTLANMICTSLATSAFIAVDAPWL